MDIAGYKIIEESKEDRKFSCIYSAVDINSGKSVLIKVFNKELSTDSLFRTHFRSVTRVLRYEPLGNNAQIIDSKVLDDACILIIEHRDFDSVYSKNNIELSDKEALEIGRQLASSLSLLHKQRIIHGGIEPTNISISKNKEVILAPAELQRTMPGENPIKQLVDKVEDIVYRAPEANYGLTASTDFYALGVLIYELLVGKKPFETESITLLEKAKGKGKYIPLDSKHRYLAPLFKKMLSPNPKFRVSNVYEFEFILSQCEELSVRQNIGFDPEYGFIAEKEIISQRPLMPKKVNILRPTIIGLFVAGTLGFIYNLTNFKSIFQVDDTTSKIPHSIETKDRPPLTVSTQSPPAEDQEYIAPNSLHASVHSLVVEENYEAALKKINDANAADSGTDTIKTLKKEIENELEIRSLLITAETQFNNSNLFSPPDNNAFETYQKVITLTPEGDNRAIDGLTKIADHFLDISIDLKEQGKYDEAKESLASGLKAKPGHRELLELKISLSDSVSIANNQPNITKKNQSTENQPAEKVTLNKNEGDLTIDNPQPPVASHQPSNSEEKQQNINLDKPRRVEASANQDDPISDNNTLPQTDTGQVETTAEEPNDHKDRWQNNIKEITKPKSQQHVTNDSPDMSNSNINTFVNPTQPRETKGTDNRIALVENQLSSSNLSTSSLEIAANNYKSLRQDTPDDERITKLHTKILNSYVTLAKKKEKSNQLTDALSATNKGLLLDSSHQELLAIKNRVRESLNHSKKWEKAGPIIGTF